MLGGGRFGIAASNCNVILCPPPPALTFHRHQELVLPSPFVFLRVLSTSGALLGFAPVSSPAGAPVPRRAELSPSVKPRAKRREENHVLSDELLLARIPSLGLLDAPHA